MLKLLKKLVTPTSKKDQNIWLNRNDPCWCGSGVKYKKCHMQADEPLRQKHRPACSLKG
ncbi:SEC-C domain-containing protein [bacterium]|nr:SEC-C domain-containing protein [candidate division CSSED10-310 bacterium]